jgi:osmoprotectant transport system permease protein
VILAATFISELGIAWEWNQSLFWPKLALFLSLSLRGLGLALVIGIPAGLALTRLPRLAAPVIGFLAVLQALPSLILLALAIPFLGIGERPVLLAAVVYSLFPIIMNTYIGVTQVPPAIRDAARGMGMTTLQIVWNVELPLGFPVLLAGVRTAAIYASAMVVIGSLIGAGGLGDFVYNGMTQANTGLIWLGTIPILVLTLAMFWSLGGLATLAKRRSSLGMSLGGGLIAVLSGYAIYGIVEHAVQPRRADLIVGARDFIEGQVLAEVIKQTVEHETGLAVEIKENLSTIVALKALKSGEIDLYPEYTGNLLTSKEGLDQGVPDDRSTITSLVRREMQRRYGLILLQPFGLNNHYVPCVTQETARRFGLKKISDLRRVPKLRVVIDQSFLPRPDGWKGLVESYDLHFEKPPTQVGPDFMYRALEAGETEIVIGFATDWQIESLELVPLADDRGYFPSYHAAPLVREEVLKRYPEVHAALDRLAGKIDDDTMRRLNYAVTKGRRKPEDIARKFLQEAGILEANK